MNYIGSKKSLLSFIDKTVREVAGEGPHTFCDIFAGTGAVGAYFKEAGHRVIANDLQYYSYVLIRHLIGNSSLLLFEGLQEEVPGLSGEPAETRPSYVLSYLSSIPGRKGFVYSNYCAGGTKSKEYERLYFSDENGKLCDAIRLRLEKWRLRGAITENEYYFLLACLIESVDKVANTASVYGAFLKSLKQSAEKPLILKPLPLLLSDQDNRVLNSDSNTAIREVEGDVLYLDPPYNHRQYAANYHILETIARDDNPRIHGKTGLRDYSEQKSRYSKKAEVKEAFSDLISKAKFRYIFLSYNNEGLLSPHDVEEVMGARGEYGFATQEYARFRADKDHATRSYADVDNKTVEYLHYVKPSEPKKRRDKQRTL